MPVQRRLFLLVILFCAALPLAAQNLPDRQAGLADFEKTVTQHKLANGMTFLIVERHQVPTVSFHLYADVGSVDEETGRSGLAHLFEHMAFKGTSTIGTKNYVLEKAALAKVDRAYAALQQERWKGKKADPKRLEHSKPPSSRPRSRRSSTLSPTVRRSHRDQRWRGPQRQHLRGLHPVLLQLPSNKLELWFSLESARFLDPVLREFYKERDVVMEERRFASRVSPSGNWWRSSSRRLPGSSYAGGIGWSSDLENLTRKNGEDFFRATTPRAT
jgi:predicted Zn-dependent peptidase